MLGQHIVGILFGFACTLQAAAQTSSSCVNDCAAQGLSASGCTALTDESCICSSDTFSSVAGDCVSTNCSPEEAAIGQADFNSVCSGVSSSSVPPTGPTSSSEGSTSTTETEGTNSTTTTTSSVISPTASFSMTTLPTITRGSTSTSVYATTTSTANTTSMTTMSSSRAVISISTSVTSAPASAPSGAAHRNTELPVALAELMVAMVVMAMF